MKIKFSFLWFFFIPLIYVTHLYKVLLFLFLIMSIHESMHIICALYLGYHIEKVTVYPFGLSATILHFEYHNSWHEMWITISGLSVHVLAAFFIPYLASCSFISSSFSSYIQHANLSLLFFNALPIYPLDGGRILRNVAELFLPYKTAKMFSMISSVIFIIASLYLLSFHRYVKILFLFLFVFQYIMLCKEYKQDIHDFYLFRFFHPCRKKPILHKIEDIYKNRNNYFIRDGQIKNEKDVLRQWI